MIKLHIHGFYSCKPQQPALTEVVAYQRAHRGIGLMVERDDPSGHRRDEIIRLAPPRGSSRNSHRHNSSRFSADRYTSAVRSAASNVCHSDLPEPFLQRSCPCAFLVEDDGWRCPEGDDIIPEFVDKGLPQYPSLLSKTFLATFSMKSGVKGFSMNSKARASPIPSRLRGWGSR